MTFIQESHSLQEKEPFLRTLLRLWLGASVIIVPLIWSTATRDAINFPKILVLYGVVIVGALLWGVILVTQKTIHIRRTVSDAVLIVLLIGLAVSTVFSKVLAGSMYGRVDAFTIHTLFMVAAILWAWLILQVCDTQKHAETFLQGFLASASLTSIFFLLGSLSFFSALMPQKILQTVSAANSVFAFLLASTGILSIGLLLVKGRSWRTQIIPVLAGGLSLWILVVTNFNIVWIAYAIGLGLLVLASIALIRHTSVLRASLLFTLFLITIGILLLGLPSSVQKTIPVEVSLGAQASWDIARPAWVNSVKTFFIGSGPGTFTIDFSKYRTALFNADPVAWTTRFSTPFSSPFALLSETGLAGVIPMLFLLFLVLGYVISAFRKVLQAFAKSPQELAIACGPEYMLPFILAITWITMTIGIAVSFVDVVFWMFWWLNLVLLLIALSRVITGVVRRQLISLRMSTQHMLAYSFGLVFVVFGTLVMAVYGYNVYAAEVAFTAVIENRVLDEQMVHMERALSRRSGYAEYQLGRARLHVERARQLAAAENADVEQIAKELSHAIEYAKQVTNRRPYAVGAWELLSLIYMNSRTISEEANTWALDALHHAIVLEPSNPLLYWRQGNVHAYAKDFMAAEQSYIRAIELKPDYIAAYTDLSTLYEQQQALTKAISVYRPIMTVVEGNTELLFQLGRLFYNRGEEGDLDRAQQVWQRALEITPEHSNTLYSLGLLHERKGAISDARTYFNKVRELNPDNEDILTKLRSL